MAFIKKIEPKSPDPYLVKDKWDHGQGSLARLAHVNAVAEEVNDALSLISDQIVTSSGSGTIPSPFLQKTATKIEYADGTVLQGWKLTGGNLVSGSNVYNNVQGTLTIPSPDGIIPGGFYIAYDTRGSVKCEDSSTGTTFEIMTAFASGADLQDTDGTSSTNGQAFKSDYMAIHLTEDTVTLGEYVISLSVAGSGDTSASGPNGGAGSSSFTGEIFYQFEFLCYEEVTPVLS